MTNWLLVRRVVGGSMLPTLKPGDIILASSIKRPQAGSIVVAKLPEREVIKRVTQATDAGYFLTGDNSAASTDSRQFGTLPKTDILGVVIMKLRFAKSSVAPALKAPRLAPLPFVVAAIWVLILLATLFKFEDFVLSLQQSPQFTNNLLAAKATAAILVLGVLFLLPFLLRMNLSPLARAISAFLVLVMPLALLVLVVFLVDDSKVAATLAAIVLIILNSTSFYVLNGRQALKALNP